MKTLYWLIVHLVFGVWLMISPYSLGFIDVPEAYWNAILVGLLFALTSAFGIYLNRGEYVESMPPPH